MNLIINSIAIISSETKKAKFQEFKVGINVVTSSGTNNGNWVGKSSLLKSIFHSLGADARFSEQWQNEGDYIYLLNFNVDNIKYLMLRKKTLFKLYNSERQELFSVSNRIKLAEKLVNLFNQKIYLKDHSGKYKLSSPAYNYLLNYIEQTRITPTEFESFLNLNEFKTYYDDLIYSHLGVNDVRYNSLKEEQENLKLENQKIEDRKKILTEFIEIVNKNGGIPLELDIFLKKINLYEKNYIELLNKINKNKKKLNDAYSLKINLENLLSELENLRNKEKSNINKELKNHTCIRCNNEISNEQLFYFANVAYIDSYGLQKLTVEDRLNNINREIELEKEHYQNLLNELENIEKKIVSNSKEIKNSIKILGLKQIEKDTILEIEEKNSFILKNDERLKEIKKELLKISKKKEIVNNKYQNYFNELLLKYPIKGITEKNIEKAINKFTLDGTHNNIAIVAWLCVLLKVKYEFNQSEVIYPLIFDTPNNANLDENNQKNIFNLLFENLPKGGQIITSLVGFKYSDYNNYKINEIILKNEPHQLLNKEDYLECINMYSYLGIF